MHDAPYLFNDLAYLATRPSELPPTLGHLSLLWAFIVGSCWGSFTNVVIARVPEGLSVVSPRSRCPKCGTQIAAWDNIPIVSYVILRGKCRQCSVRIPWRYPFIEALAGVAAMAV